KHSPKKFPHPYQFANFKRQGEWAELVFMARAAALGCTVLKPFGESARYDVVVDDRGRLLRVNVKSVNTLSCGRYLVDLQTTRMARYKASDLDYFAVYVMPHDTWYIIPVRAALRYCNIEVRPNQVTSSTRFERFRECWHLLLKAYAVPGWRDGKKVWK